MKLRTRLLLERGMGAPYESQGVPTTSPPSARAIGLESTRVLVVDDSATLHECLHRVLVRGPTLLELGTLEQGHSGAPTRAHAEPGHSFHLDHETQAQAGLARVAASRAEGRPYAVACLDVRAPAGRDGMETASRMLAADGQLQVAVCAACSEHSWPDVAARIGATDRLLFLRKPLDDGEAMQVVHSLATKWHLLREAARHRQSMAASIVGRNAEVAAVNGELLQAICRQDETEEALAASERRFRALAAQAPVGIFETSATGDWTYANDRCREMLGKAGVEDLGGLSLLSSIHQDDRAKVHSLWQKATLAGTELTSEHRYSTAQGRTLWAAVSAVPERDAKGRVSRWIGTLVDISERKLRDTEAVLTGRLASMGTLAAGLAHEINNPLAYLKANLDLLAERIAGDSMLDVAEMVADARDGAARIGEMVGHLKSFSRVDDTEQRVPIALEGLLEASLKIAANQIRHTSQLQRDYGAVPVVLGDAGRLAQVFVNLLINATQALAPDRSGNEIRVSTRTLATGEAMVEVRDNGSGIAPAQVARIFDPFFTTKRIGEGTGLGLSICHSIVAAHGGRMEVDSELGHGTSIRVVLPADVAAAVRGTTVQSTVPCDATGAHVLLVDDEPYVAKALRRCLLDHHVDVARSGTEALTRLAQRNYDVVLCDLMMPGITGPQLFAEIQRRWPSLADRVVFMTGGAFTPEAQAFLDACSNAHLAKPFDVAQVRAVVSRHVGAMSQSAFAIGDTSGHA